MKLLVLLASLGAALHGEKAPDFIVLTPFQQQMLLSRLDDGVAKLKTRSGGQKTDWEGKLARVKRATLDARAYRQKGLDDTALLYALELLLSVNRELGEAEGLELTPKQQRQVAATAHWLLDYFAERAREAAAATAKERGDRWDTTLKRLTAARTQLTELAFKLAKGETLSPAEQHELLEICFEGFNASNWQTPRRIVVGQAYAAESKIEIEKSRKREIPRTK